MTDIEIKESNLKFYHLILGKSFVADHSLQAGTKYPIIIRDLEDGQAQGTLQTTNTITGLAKLFRSFNIAVGSSVQVDFQDGSLIIQPPPDTLISSQPAPSKPVLSAPGFQTKDGLGNEPVVEHPLQPSPLTERVFSRQKLKHIHIPEFAPANLVRWSPETETDVFLVFGKLSELTNYRFCCGASKALLDKLGYRSVPKEIAGTIKSPKPDSILIDRTTDEYLVGEFKIYSSDFTLNHSKEDVDVLICWIDDAADKTLLPSEIVSLKSLREDAVKNGDIPLDELS